MSITRTSVSLPALTVALIAFGASAPAHACTSTPYVGSLCLTGAKTCPRGTLETNGKTLAIAQYGELFRVIGTTFGGDGKTKFGLPSLRDRAPQPGL